jgi:glycosyltransferase involved in cell wall biosynthesis
VPYQLNKNILEICLSPDLGGLELHVKNLAEYLNTSCVINKTSKLESFLKEASLPYHTMGRYSIFALAKIIDENKIDVVHLHWTKDIPVVVLAKLLSKRKPKIVQTRHMHMTRFKNDFYHKFLYKNINTIIAVTNLVKEQLTEFIPVSVRPKITTCYIGAKTPKQLNQEEIQTLKSNYGLSNEFIVAIVGRIEEPKGQHIVLQAVEKLRQNGIPAKTLVIGHAMNETYLNELKIRYNEDIFTGFVNNASDLMQIASCLVLATQKETFGLVLIEAMKCEICVVGSNQGGPLEIIDDKENGLLFESMNSDDLYQKLLILTNDPTKKEQLAQKGKEKADMFFDSQTQFKTFKTLLENV